MKIRKEVAFASVRVADITSVTWLMLSNGFAAYMLMGCKHPDYVTVIGVTYEERENTPAYACLT